MIYNELRRIARKCLAREPHGHTLQSTALVHEAYLKLIQHDSVRWDNRVHFFAVAAQIMRRILVDHARSKKAKKRGGNSITLVLEESTSAAGKEREINLLALDVALDRLAKLDQRQCRLPAPRFFAGLSIEETAHVMEISPATVKREWMTARLWLLREMTSFAQM